VILASHNFKPAYVAWALGLLLRKPVVVWVHGPLFEVLEQAHASPFKRAWLRWLYHRLPRFVFVSRASQESFERFMHQPLGAHQHGDVIPNAVVPMALPANSLWAADAATVNPQLAYIGRLSQEKRPLILLDMLRLLPAQFRLTLVGDGPLRDELRQSGADLLASGRLTLAGPQAHGPGLYAPWHMTLLASRYEGCPMTLLESFTMGVPCVGLPIAALQEVVGVDAPYLLARDVTAQALVDAVQTVWAMPRQQVQADMARVLSRYQVRDFVQSWQTVLREAVQRC
jgi:glycosyltransferase involved in cell wall biosynthesis